MNEALGIWEAVESVAGDNQDIERETKIAELAKLSLIEYEHTRKQAAEALCVRAPILDKAVANARTASPSESGQSGTPLDFENVEPWPISVVGAELLDSLYNTIRRFVICDPKTARAAALWIVFTWLIDDVQVAPIAMITAPEKRCGKTVLLSLFNRLCLRPLPAANISPAAIFRCVEAWAPTLLIDEADAFLRDNEDARGILNSGHTRDTAFVIRVVGENLEPRRFSTWGAKAIAGIGKLADTLTDRSIPLVLRRKLPGESAEKIRHAEPNHFTELRRRIARWSADNAATVRQTRAESIASINDRAQDNWEPLLSIADVVGGEWPHLARSAALELCGAVQESPSINAELLADVREIFELRKVDRIVTAELIDGLCDDEEKPWATWNRGKRITPKQIANRLREFGISSGTVRSTGYGSAGTGRGYKIEQFGDAFDRYLTQSSPSEVTQRNMTTATRVAEIFTSDTQAGACHIESSVEPRSDAGCVAVSHRNTVIDADMEEFEV